MWWKQISIQWEVWQEMKCPFHIVRAKLGTHTEFFFVIILDLFFRLQRPHLDRGFAHCGSTFSQNCCDNLRAPRVSYLISSLLRLYANTQEPDSEHAPH